MKNLSHGNYVICSLSELSFNHHPRSSYFVDEETEVQISFRVSQSTHLTENQTGNCSFFSLSSLHTAQQDLLALPPNNRLTLENHLISLDSHNGMGGVSDETR